MTRQMCIMGSKVIRKDWKSSNFTSVLYETEMGEKKYTSLNCL